MNDMRRIREKAQEIMNEPHFYVKVDIFIELDAGLEREISDNELDSALDFLADIYFEIDYSTPTGLGVVAIDWLSENSVWDYNSYESMRKDFLEGYYFGSEWR